MADRFNNHNDDIQELLNMLDRMRTTTDHRVGSEAAQADFADWQPITGETEPSADGFDPELPSMDLADLLITPFDMDEEEERLAPVPSRSVQKKSARPAADTADEPLPPPAERIPLRQALAQLLPAKTDAPLVKRTKVGFVTALVALLAATAVLVVTVAVLPWYHRRMNEELAEWYYDRPQMSVIAPDVPAGIGAHYSELYRANPEIKGWLSFHSKEGTDVVDMDYPIVQTDNNDTYCRRDFYGRYSRYGTLHFDAACRIEKENNSRGLIVYGNTVGSGQMLTGLNRLVGNLSNARAAAGFTLGTLYEEKEYYIFAVMVLDKEETEQERTVVLRHRFITDTAFLEYTQQLRARSLFDYPTDINDQDSLVYLVTDLGDAAGPLTDAQVVVVARPRRVGEGSLNTSAIVKNEDVVMPYRWYVEHKVHPHPYYLIGAQLPTTTTTTQYTPTGTTTSGSLWMPDTTTDPMASTDSTVSGESTDPTDYTDPTGSTDPTVITDPTADPTASQGESTDPSAPTDFGGTTLPTDSTTEPSAVPTEILGDPTVPTETEDTSSATDTEPIAPTAETDPTDPTEPTLIEE